MRSVNLTWRLRHHTPLPLHVQPGSLSRRLRHRKQSDFNGGLCPPNHPPLHPLHSDYGRRLVRFLPLQTVPHVKTVPLPVHCVL